MRIRSRALLPLFATALIVLQGCSSAPKARRADGKGGVLGQGGIVPGAPAQNAAGAEAKESREILSLFSKGLYDSAITRATAFTKKYPTGPQLAAVENLWGLSLLMTNRPLQAIAHFKRSREASAENRVFKQYVLYNLAKAHFDAGQMEDCQQALAEIAIDVMDRENRLKVHYLKSRLYARINLPVDSVREALVASRLMNDAEARDSRAAFAKAMDQALGEIKGTEPLEILNKEFSDAPYIDAVLYRLAALELASGASGASEAHAKLILDKHSEGPYSAQARELLSSTQSQTIVDTRVVGVLLPLKGKFGRFGQKTLQAMELALRFFESQEPESQASKITLVVEDSGDEAEQAVAGLNNLVFKHHAAVVVGPLLSKGISQVTQRAQELGIPLISLARAQGAGGDYVFQSGITLQMQAQEIARYAYESLGIRRFAILTPNDKVGEEAGQRFWDAVESLGGKVVGYEAYTPGETDFRVPIDKLVGTHFSEARQRELDAMAKEREANNIHRRTRKTEQFFALKPIIDFEGVFIPDEPKVAGQILPTFAYRDVDKIKFLGTSAWNSPVFVERAQAYADHAYFVDAFQGESQQPKVKAFVERFKAMTGQDPTAMEAVAFDAASILDALVTTAQPSLTRADFKELLKGVRGFNGITGRISYRDGQFYRELRALRFKGGKIEEQGG